MAENGKRANVLLVDDNPANLLAIETVLEDLGQNLVKARSGREALHHLLEDDFAVIVLDVNMPDMSGFEAASLIRQRLRSEHTPIVFISAISHNNDSALHGYGLGAVDYINSPVAPEVLRAKVKVFVDLFCLNRELQKTVHALDEDVAERKRVEAALRESEARLQMLHEIDRAILAAQSPAEIAQIAAQHLRQSLPCERVAVLLFNPQRLRGNVLAVDSAYPSGMFAGDQVEFGACRTLSECHDGRPGVVEDLAALPDRSALEEQAVAEGLRSCACIPLMADSQLIGVLEMARQEPGAFAEAGFELALQVADSLAVAIQNARLHEQVQLSRARLQSLSRRLVQVQEDERRAIARELHDEAGQALTALTVGLGLAQREPSCSEPVAERLRALKDMTVGVMDELHALAVDLRPVALDKLGLLATLNQYVQMLNESGDLRVEFAASGFDGTRLPIETETTVYRVIQEAVTNVVRHAQASRAHVSLNHSGRSIVATVADDGVGFDVDEALRAGRLGLVGMRERIELLGGMLTIESAPGKGAKLAVEVPLEAG